jgi:hypothetical protein
VSFPIKRHLGEQQGMQLHYKLRVLMGIKKQNGCWLDINLLSTHYYRLLVQDRSDHLVKIILASMLLLPN